MASGFTTSSGSPGKKPGFFGRNRAAFIAGVAAVIVLALIAILARNTTTAPPVKQVETVTIIPVQPPKPPPPPPVQQQMIQQPKVTMSIPKPMQPAPPTKVAQPKAAAPASTPMSTSVKGNTPNNFDLAGSGNGDGLLDGGGGGGSGVWSAYASQLQDEVRDALDQNSTTRSATAGLQVQVYIDASGIIQRVVLVHPSGNTIVDQAIENEVLMHFKLDPPPAGMPMPINVSLTGQSSL